MAVTRSAAKTASRPVARAGVTQETFVWQGTDKRGTRMKGEEQSKNANRLRAELRRRGISPIFVKPKPKPLFGSAGKPITPKEIAVFSRQLATMIKSGVPLVTALEIIGNGNKNARMKKLVNDLRLDIEGGSSIYEAMSKHPVQFDELYRNLVKAGECAGVLETVLDTSVMHQANIEILKGKIKQPLFYTASELRLAI